MNRYVSVTRTLALAAGCALCLATGAAAKVLLYAPDGRTVEIKGGTTQPDLSAYRSPLDSKVVDRRFITNDATFLANESYKFGMEGFNDIVKAALPVAYRKPFHWVTGREMYFYARYLLDYIGGRGHAGVNMVHAPYWTLQAQRHSAYNKLQRDRGERAFSNKDILLGVYLPLVYQRTGFPRVFDDVQLSYVQYKSVDPHFIGRLDNRDSFEDPMSGKAGGWGQPNTYLNDYEQRFDHDKMDTTFDLGAIGQFVKRRAQWASYFFHSEHTGESVVSRGVKVPLLGNDAEEGMRGFGLIMGALNAILEVKSSMFTDGEKLEGINPATYDPAAGLRYIPHEVEPDIMWVGDIPERIWALDLKDNSSRLWDQASWIWGTAEYAMAVSRRPLVFTDNPPVDGGLVEKGTTLVAEALGNAVLKNIEAMHLRNGILVSQWTPETGAGTSVSMRDLAMAMVALHDLEQTWETIDKYPEAAERAIELLEENAGFLLEVQGPDGSFYEAYDVSSGEPIGANDLSAPNWAGVRALLAAYFSTEDESFLAAARKTFNLLNRDYWVEPHGVYRTRLGDDTVTLTPYDIGIALAAMREMLLTTPTHMADPQIERIVRWWVQTVDQSGAQQSENQRTGEIYTGFISGDDDADGIPYTSKGDGSNGIAPVIASKVVINVGAPENQAFAAVPGEPHNPNKYKAVRMGYEPKSREEQLAILLPLENPTGPDLVERGPMVREDGTLIPLPASKPIKTGVGTVLNLSGRQIFEANCSMCHGQHGEGIDGLPLEKDSNRSHEAMFKIVNTGRFEKFMPPWGAGNADGFGGSLTKAEIDKIVEYVQSDVFKDNFQKLQRGEVIAGSLPKDVWFYLSRENAKAKGTQISNADDARRYFVQHPDPAEIKAQPWENVPRTKPDAELSLDDREPLLRRLGLTGEAYPSLARKAD
ncbi:MAG: c-type cytochrome [Alphaproteobacteria bacterium]